MVRRNDGFWLMSTSVPRISGRAAIKAFEKAGFVVDRIKGSHHILKKTGHVNRLSVPVHRNKTLGVGLLSSLIKAAGMTCDEFAKLL